MDGWSLLGLVNPERVMMSAAFVALRASNFGHNVRIICILHGVLEKEKGSLRIKLCCGLGGFGFAGKCEWSWVSKW